MMYSKMSTVLWLITLFVVVMAVIYATSPTHATAHRPELDRLRKSVDRGMSAALDRLDESIRTLRREFEKRSTSVESETDSDSETDDSDSEYD